MTAVDTVPVVVEPTRLGEAAGYVLLAFGAGFPFYVLVSKPLDSALIYGFLAVLWVLPFLMTAAIIMARVTVDAQGVTSQGLWKQTTISWDGMERVRLFRGSAGIREITVYGCGAKISLVNELFYFSKSNFWPAARIIATRARESQVTVQTGWWGRDFWSHPGDGLQSPDGF